MGFFDKKKETEEEIRAAAKKKEFEKVRKLTELQVTQIPSERFIPYRSEYKEFLKETKQKPTTLYEKACAFAEKILPVEPTKKMGDGIQSQLVASYIHATPRGVLSLTVIVTSIVIFFALIGIVIGGGTGFILFSIGFITAVTYYFYNYPSNQQRIMSMRMSADTVLAILYMVVYMRTSPNLEGAIKFASQHLTGPLAWDLRKLLWDIEVGVYSSADEALVSYIFKWKDKNREFAESLHLLRTSAVEASKRDTMYTEAVNLILSGTKERTKHYASNLRMPVMLIHSMGVLLPVMGLVLFPVVLIFMGDVIKPSFIFIGYNILLPAFLYFFTDYILQTKPPTFSQPDLSQLKDVPPLGQFALGKRFIPLWPVGLAVAVPMIAVGFLGYYSSNIFTAVNSSILLIFGLAFGVAVYTLLDAYQKMKIRKDIERIEDEFSVALFQLGNTLSSGIPIEIAVDRAREKLKNLKIVEMFDIVSLNMKKFGYTFEQALFDKEVGAIWRYPSKLIQSIMQTIIESSKKSVAAAADSMIVISQYLKNVHDIKEEIDDILGETISSMKFLSMFLAPLVSGVTVTMAVIILQIIKNLTGTLGGIAGASGGYSAAQIAFIMPSLLGGGLPISPPQFQLTVGLYMVETAILMAIFLNRIQYGEDSIGERDLIGKILIISSIIYFITWYAVYSVFGSALAQILTPAV